MFDVLSYVIGKMAESGNMTIETDKMIFADDGKGNITVTEGNNGE